SRVYAIGPGPDDFAVLPIAAGERRLRAEVQRFRAAIESRRGPALRRGLDQQSWYLGRLLLGPAAERLGRARRLLVVPDGVLHLVPFGALHDPSSGAGERARYLVETLPLHVVSSITLQARLASAPRATATRVVGFG